jgi:hypothetical protein
LTGCLDLRNLKAHLPVWGKWAHLSIEQLKPATGWQWRILRFSPSSFASPPFDGFAFISCNLLYIAFLNYILNHFSAPAIRPLDTFFIAKSLFFNTTLVVIKTAVSGSGTEKQMETSC